MEFVQIESEMEYYYYYYYCSFCVAINSILLFLLLLISLYFGIRIPNHTCLYIINLLKFLSPLDLLFPLKIGGGGDFVFWGALVF